MINDKKLVIGKKYKVVYKDPYKSLKSHYNVEITGLTNISKANQHSDYDIRGELFTKLKLGISTYVTNINDNIEIYVATPIAKLSPLKMESSPILIPKSLINFDATQEYVECNRMKVELNDILRHFDTFTEESTFVETMFKELNTLSKNTSTLAGTPVRYTRSSSLEWIEENIFNAIEAERLSKIELHQINKDAYEGTKDSERDSLYRLKIDLENRKLAYETESILLVNKLAELEVKTTESDIYQTQLDAVTATLRIMVEDLHVKYPSEVGTFDQLWTEASS